jgi:hypothetical protein
VGEPGLQPPSPGCRPPLLGLRPLRGQGRMALRFLYFSTVFFLPNLFYRELKKHFSKCRYVRTTQLLTLNAWILWIVKVITFTAKNKLRYLKNSWAFLDNDRAFPVNKRLQAKEGVLQSGEKRGVSRIKSDEKRGPLRI